MTCPEQESSGDFSIEITTTNPANITVTLNGKEAPHSIVYLGGISYRLDFAGSYYDGKTGTLLVKDGGHQIACRQLV